MRNFVTGIVLGGVVAGAGLVVASQMAPLQPANTAKAPALASAEPEPAARVSEPPSLSEPAAAPPETQPGVAPDPQDLVPPTSEEDEPLLRPMADDSQPPAAVVPDLAPVETPAEPPKADAPPATGISGEGAAAGQTATTEAADAQGAGAAGDAPAAAEASLPPAEPAAEPAPAESVTDAAPEPAPEPPPSGAAQPAEIPLPAEPAPTLQSTLQPEGQIGDKVVEGVTTGRLPSISAPTEATPAAETDPEGTPPADLPPVRRFARSFDNAAAKPLFAVLLLDDGGPDVPRAELAALPFPVSFVLDPMAPGAAEAAAIYRAAGQEVVMAATNIPKGATASDLEQSFAAIEGVLPEAVALIDTPVAAFQNDRKLASEVVTLLADQGRGLVTYDRGLNAADQVARREGLATATIFRSLDDDGEDAPLIRRYLDRAAFKAAQEGKVAVIGTARPETITALMEWAVEGRAASVALAPVSALMTE